MKVQEIAIPPSLMREAGDDDELEGFEAEDEDWEMAPSLTPEDLPAAILAEDLGDAIHEVSPDELPADGEDSDSGKEPEAVADAVEAEVVEEEA